MKKGAKVAEGKTKVVWEDPENPDCVLIESKNDITSGDGAQRDDLEGKAAAATSTTCNVFHVLNREGISTHYRSLISSRTFQAARAEMIPLECVVRRVATGSYLKRNPEAVEGEVFEAGLVFELFHKDDEAHDPIIRFDLEQGVAIRYPADQPEGADPIDKITVESLDLGKFPVSTLEALEQETKRVFEVIESYWAKQDVQLVDLKIEFGWIPGPEKGYRQLVVADVIDNDSWRIWPHGDKTKMKDKQVYRDLAGVEDPKARAKKLGKIKEDYKWVANATGRFV